MNHINSMSELTNRRVRGFDSRRIECVVEREFEVAGYGGRRWRRSTAAENTATRNARGTWPLILRRDELRRRRRSRSRRDGEPSGHDLLQRPYYTVPVRFWVRDALKKERDRDRERNERSEVKAERLFYFYFLELVFFF